MSGVGGLFFRVGKKCKHDDDFYFSGQKLCQLPQPSPRLQRKKIALKLISSINVNVFF